MNEQLSRHGWETAAARTDPLFKFRVFDPVRDPDPEWQGYAASLLRDGLIYCASPHDLNDPWEGRPPFTIPDPQTDPEHARRFGDMLYETSQGGGSRDDLEDWLQRVGYAAAARELQDVHWRDNRGVGLFCMAGNPVHPLMWSYYALGHQGFCWIIDHQQRPFSAAAKVDYLPDCPTIDWARWKQLNLVKLALLTKAQFWQHEDEYRIIVPRVDAPEHFTIVPHNGNGQQPRGRFLRVDPESIVGVIFGAGMSLESRRVIAGLATQYRPQFEFNAAALHRRQYRMAIRLIEGEELTALL